MANIATAISPAPAVTCLTTGGSVATGYTGDVTVSLSTNPTGATLGGTLTVSASAGVATFSDLTVSRSGKNFKLSATATGLRTVTSAAFSIPTQLVFTTQPSSTAAGSTMSNVVVTVRDGAGNTDTAYTGTVTLALYTASAAGTLSGTLSVAAVAGVATFSTLSINVAGTYTFIASASEVSTAYLPASVVSNSFSIGFVSLAVTRGFAFSTYGYSDILGMGSVSPTTLLGATIGEVIMFPSEGLYINTITLNSIVGQNFFTSVTGALGDTFNVSDASYGEDGGKSQWVWSANANPFFSEATGAATVIINL